MTVTDARTLDDGDRLTADLCIVGAGPAGITLVRALATSGLRIVVVESGGFDAHTPTQALAGGDLVGEPMRFFGDRTLADLRVRQFGGSSNHWTGLCRPLDPIDFAPIAARPFWTWPFDYDELEPWYRKAQVDCQLGPYEYSAEHWGRELGFTPIESDAMAMTVLQQSPPTRFGRVYRDEVTEVDDVEVLTFANVVGLRTSGARRVTDVLIRTLHDTEVRVTASRVVLACGAIENARLLLLGDPDRDGPLGASPDIVGRTFLEHPAVHNVRIVLGLDPALHRAIESGVAEGPAGDVKLRFAFVPRESTIVERGFPNAGVVLRPVIYGEGETDDDVITSLDMRSLVRRRHGGRGELFAGAVVWEQAPNSASRVLSAGGVDGVGLPATQLDWQLTEADRIAPELVLDWLGRELGALDLGRVELQVAGQPPRRSAVECSSHHMGTTRMDVDPTVGVVDADCRVHGMENLWICGSSVFPTAGWANPTLTVVALAHRLAAHLAGD